MIPKQSGQAVDKGGLATVTSSHPAGKQCTIKIDEKTETDDSGEMWHVQTTQTIAEIVKIKYVLNLQCRDDGR